MSGRLYAARRAGTIRPASHRHPSDRNSYARTHTYTYADVVCDADDSWRHAADANADCAHLHSNAHAHRDRNAYYRPRPNADIHTDCHRHAVVCDAAASYSYPDANRQSERAAFGYASAADCNADRDAATNRDATTNRDTTTNCNPIADCNAGAYYCDSADKHPTANCAAVCSAVAFAAVVCGAVVSREKLACPSPLYG